MSARAKKTIEDFPLLKEAVPALRAEEARTEAERCLYCYDAPCQKACPTHIDIPRFIKQIAAKDEIGSAETIFDANPFGHSCARVCPVEVLCEGSCVYRDWQERPISIARLQRHATDSLMNAGVLPFEPGRPNGKKIAVVGAGPAGLSCAAYLRRLGFSVTVFDRKPLPGGLSTYGMAEYKMDQAVALDETALLEALGLELLLGKTLGRDVSLSSLEKSFDAVFLGVGLGATAPLGIPGESLKGVYEALHFIEYIKAHDFGAVPPGEATVCIGAGNTAVDVVTQAKRIGTARVVMSYRRGQDEMPAYDYEYALAAGDAVEFQWFTRPVSILGKKKVEGVRLRRTELKKGKIFDVKGSDFTIRCDRVVKAIGQSKQVEFLSRTLGIALDEKGRILVDAQTMRSSRHGVFAGGDAVNGGKEIVNAAQDGKKAALGIFRELFPGREPEAQHARWIASIEGVRAVRPPNHHHGKEAELQKI